MEELVKKKGGEWQNLKFKEVSKFRVDLQILFQEGGCILGAPKI